MICSERLLKSATQGKNLMTEKFLPHGNFF